jgi:hypothetical protein
MEEQRENGETDQGQHSSTPWNLGHAHPPSSMCGGSRLASVRLPTDEIRIRPRNLPREAAVRAEWQKYVS